MTNIRTLLSSITSSSLLTIVTNTDPRLQGGKKNEHKGHVRKVTTMNVRIYQNDEVGGYEELVKEGLKKEDKNPDSFQVGRRSCGTRLGRSCFIQLKDEIGVEFIVEHSSKPIFELDGEVIEKSKVIGLPTSNGGGSQGGLTKKVIVRTLKLSSLTSIEIDGTTHTDFHYPT